MDEASPRPQDTVSSDEAILCRPIKVRVGFLRPGADGMDAEIYEPPMAVSDEWVSRILKAIQKSNKGVTAEDLARLKNNVKLEDVTRNAPVLDALTEIVAEALGKDVAWVQANASRAQFFHVVDALILATHAIELVGRFTQALVFVAQKIEATEKKETGKAFDPSLAQSPSEPTESENGRAKSIEPGASASS
jgi:hypothetical protein